MPVGVAAIRQFCPRFNFAMADDIVNLVSSSDGGTPKNFASAATSAATSMSPEFGTKLSPLLSPSAPEYSPVANTQAAGGCPRHTINSLRSARNLDKELVAARATEKGPSAGNGVGSESDPEDLTEYPDASPEESGILGKYPDGRRATVNSKIANLIIDGKTVRLSFKSMILPLPFRRFFCILHISIWFICSFF